MAIDSGSTIKGKKGYWLMGRLWRITYYSLRAEGRVGKRGLEGEKMEVNGQRECKGGSAEAVGRGGGEENDLGQYGSRQTALGRADYIKGFGRGNEIRAEVKSRCQWGVGGGRSVVR